MVENPNRKVEKLLPEERLGGNGLFARITVFPGREIDYHEHHGETETYHIIAGEGVYGDNGAERAFYAETGSLTDRKKPAKSYDFADFLECVDKKDAGALREFLRLLFSLILKYYNSCDLSTKIDKILNLFAG